MRLIHKLRLLVLAAPVIALLGIGMPSAHAVTAATVVFQGTATTGNLSYPCFPPATITTSTTTTTPPFITITSTKCPILDGQNGTINTAAGPVNVPVGGNPVGFAFGSGPCVGAAVNTAGPTVAAGTCVIGAAGTLQGSCGLSIGHGVANATVSPPANVGTTVAPVTANGIAFQWVSAGGTLVLVSDPVPGATNLVAVVQAVPVPVVTPGVPPTLGNSCSAKTASTFLIIGTALLVA